MSVILTSFPIGVPGTLATANDYTIDTGLIQGNNQVAAYGIAVKVDNVGFYTDIEAGDAADVFAGVTVRHIPGMPDFAASGPPTDRPLAVLQRGKIVVKCLKGSPVKGGPVYMRVQTSGANHIGDFEAEASGAESVLLPDVVWATSSTDENNHAILYVQKV